MNADNDVLRSARDIQEVSYAVSADGVRRAIMSWLYDDHNGVFTPDTTITIHEDGSATVTTPFVTEEEATNGD